MTIRNNGQKRNGRMVLSSLFLLIVGLICLYFTFHNGFRWAWLLISAAILYLSFAMFRNSNEG